MAHIPTPRPTGASVNAIVARSVHRRRTPAKAVLVANGLSLDDADDAVIDVTKRPVTGDLPRGARESSWSPISFSRFPSSVYA